MSDEDGETAEQTSVEPLAPIEERDTDVLPDHVDVQALDEWEYVVLRVAWTHSDESQTEIAHRFEDNRVGREISQARVSHVLREYTPEHPSVQTAGNLKRDAILTHARENPHLTDAQIADRVDCSASYAHTIRDEYSPALPTADDIEPSAGGDVDSDTDTATVTDGAGVEVATDVPQIDTDHIARRNEDAITVIDTYFATATEDTDTATWLTHIRAVLTGTAQQDGGDDS